MEKRVEALQKATTAAESQAEELQKQLEEAADVTEEAKSELEVYLLDECFVVSFISAAHLHHHRYAISFAVIHHVTSSLHIVNSSCHLLTPHC